MAERRYAAFRVAGRTLSGTALVYGDVSPDFRERFVPGAFGPEIRALPVNLQHDPTLIVVDAAALIDGPRALEIRADLPEGSAALDIVIERASATPDAIAVEAAIRLAGYLSAVQPGAAGFSQSDPSGTAQSFQWAGAATQNAWRSSGASALVAPYIVPRAYEGF